MLVGRVCAVSIVAASLAAACAHTEPIVSPTVTLSTAVAASVTPLPTVVATAVGGIPALVDDGVNAILADAGDVEALSECLRECWDGSRTRQMGVAARQRVERDFSLQTMIGQYVSLFRGILGGRRGDAAACCA